MRIGCSGFDETVKATAFENPDGSIAAVVLNTRDEAAPVCLRLESCTAKATLPPRSMATFVITD